MTASADVRNAALRGAEPFLAKAMPPSQAAVLKKADDPSWQVRRQLAASLGELPADARIAPVVMLLKKYGNDQITVDAAISGLKGLEAEALSQLLAQPDANADAVEMLAGAAGKSRDVGAGAKADRPGDRCAATRELAARDAQRRRHRPERARMRAAMAAPCRGRPRRRRRRLVAAAARRGEAVGASRRAGGPDGAGQGRAAIWPTRQRRWSMI